MPLSWQNLFFISISIQRNFGTMSTCVSMKMFLKLFRHKTKQFSSFVCCCPLFALWNSLNLNNTLKTWSNMHEEERSPDMKIMFIWASNFAQSQGYTHISIRKAKTMLYTFGKQNSEIANLIEIHCFEKLILKLPKSFIIKI